MKCNRSHPPAAWPLGRNDRDAALVLVEPDPRNTASAAMLACAYRQRPPFSRTPLRWPIYILAVEPAECRCHWDQVRLFLGDGNPGSGRRRWLPILNADLVVPRQNALVQRRYSEGRSDILTKAIERQARAMEKALTSSTIWPAQQRARRGRRGARLPKSGARNLQRELGKVSAGLSGRVVACMPVWVGAHAGLGEAGLRRQPKGERHMPWSHLRKTRCNGPGEEEAMARHLRSAGGCGSRDSHSQAAGPHVATLPRPRRGCCASIRCGIQIRNDPRFQELAAEERDRETSKTIPWRNCGDPRM